MIAPRQEPTDAELARIGYDGYYASTGGKTFDGRDMPTFDEIAARSPTVVRAWEANAAAIRVALCGGAR